MDFGQLLVKLRGAAVRVRRRRPLAKTVESAPQMGMTCPKMFAVFGNVGKIDDEFFTKGNGLTRLGFGFGESAVCHKDLD